MIAYLSGVARASAAGHLFAALSAIEFSRYLDRIIPPLLAASIVAAAAWLVLAPQ